MKPIHLFAAVTLSISGLAFAAGGHEHGHEHKPLHGGVVSEVKDMDYELVAKPDSIVELKPAGQQLEAAGSFKFANSKIVALVSVPGKAPATVRFVLK